jgi:hypothetical protein
LHRFVGLAGDDRRAAPAGVFARGTWAVQRFVGS